MVDNNTGFSKPATSKEPPSVCCSEETSPGSPLWGGGRGDGGGDREGGRRRRIRSESSQSWSRDRGGGTFGSRPHWSWSGPEMAFSPYSQQLIWGQNLNFEENLDGRLLSLGVSVVVGSPEDFTTLCHLTIIGQWRIAFWMPTILDTFIYIDTLVLYCWSHHQNVTSNPEAWCANALLRGSMEIVCFFSIVCLFYLSSRNDKISIYRNDKIFTISVIYKREWASTLSNSSSHVQPWGVRIAYSNFSICTAIFWMVMVQFAQQHFEWQWCSSLFTFFLAFANLGAHVSSTIIPVLPSWESSYWINKWISTSTFFVYSGMFTWPVL